MPTIGSQPSLQNTQAVGAILLHKFVRERFKEAGINEYLIQEAENQENIEQITASLLQDDLEENSQSETSKTSVSTLVNESSIDDINQNNTMANITDAGEQYQSVFAELSINSQPDKGFATNKNSTLVDESNTSHISTCQSQNSTNNSTSEVNDQYQSIADSSANSHGNTVWHSINASRIPPPKLDHLQSLPVMASYGRELRKLADEFEKSRYRQTVKEKAEEVNLKDITKEAFVSLLEEVFKGGVTRERIVSLFFFCTDVALRAASFAQELVVRLLGWSFSYIINTVCKLVHESGGWDDLLFRQLPLMLFNGCAFLALLVLAVYLHKNLRASS